MILKDTSSSDELGGICCILSEFESDKDYRKPSSAEIRDVDALAVLEVALLLYDAHIV